MTMTRLILVAGVVMLSCLVHAGDAPSSAESLRDRAAKGLRRAVEFFAREVAVQGTYVWQYSEDLSLREGEGVASATRGWVQQPGTPSVGFAILAAYEATRDQFYLETARETAHGLVLGQLESGGWTYFVEFDPAQRNKFAFRQGGKSTGRNVTTLDDDNTQAALRFLIRVDGALERKDTRIHECVQYALDHLLRAQYPNGAWPQGYDRFPEPDRHPVKRASYPDSWSRTWPGNGQYRRCYTLNDNALGSTIDTMFEADRVYGPPAPENDLSDLAARCRTAAARAGDFLLLAQMPDPQPAWAQQYDFDMHPAWARKFEPPAVTGGESQNAMNTLLRLYTETGQRKYIEPIPRAIEYLRRSRLPDGRLARFYELRSNKPLYFTKDYELTYEDRDAPTHYAFKVPDDTESITRGLQRLQSLSSGQLASASSKKPPKANAALERQVKTVLAAQDARGRWVEDGGLKYHPANDKTKRVIRTRTFVRNIELLSRYLTATRD